jgi:hypothetical protein
MRLFPADVVKRLWWRAAVLAALFACLFLEINLVDVTGLADGYKILGSMVISTFLLFLWFRFVWDPYKAAVFPEWEEKAARERQREKEDSEARIRIIEEMRRRQARADYGGFGQERFYFRGSNSQGYASGSDSESPKEADDQASAFSAADLKKMHREAAKRFHPDLARDKVDRAKREELMKAANTAFGRGDGKALEALLSD